MTERKSARAKTCSFNLNLPFLFFISVAVVLTFNADAVRESIVDGIRLSALSVIPSLFPFFILSDFLSCGYIPGSGIISRVLCGVLGISQASLGSVIIGSVCGFPLGIKAATELYSERKISREECEKLCAVTNNPSMAFVISGVGAGMRGNISEGVILYISVVISSIVMCILVRSKFEKTPNFDNISRQRFDLNLSIKSSALSSLYVSSYIIFFSALLGFLRSICKNVFLNITFATVLEIGNAVFVISKTKILSRVFAFTLSGFALGFSGISVFMQAASYIPPEISKAKLLGYKLIQGAISAVCAAVLYSFFC